MGVLINISTRKPVEKEPEAPHTPIYGSGNGGGGDMLEPRIARLESDVSYIRRDIDELKSDVKSVSQSMIIALERLETIKESLNKKPSTDAVDKKISEAKLAVLLGVPAIIAVGTGIYKAFQHFF
ncbi:hypothetical protein [Pantoea agglomerans]|uniref:hypothetical protein n=1 Tax=Enterobacter agglomerans TaxID=549 RepID=UPI003C7A872E